MLNFTQRARSIVGAASLAAVTSVFTYALPAASQTTETAGVLQPGEYVQGLSYKRYTQPYVLQRLTDRTYMVSVSTHNATVYVSDSGVLVFDPLSNGYGQAVLEAIGTITDLPVTALVYSHFHLDHLSDAQLFVDAAEAKGTSLRIVAPAAVAAQIERYGNPIPAPTEVIQEDPGSFSFGELNVRVESAADTHSVDNTMFLLEQEKVLHYLDTVEPEDFLPYFRLVGVLDIAPMEETLRYVKTLDWVFLNAGHGNVGSRDDIDKHLELVSDIRNATGAALGTVSFEQFIDPASDVLVWVNNFHEAVTDNAIEKLRANYGDHPRFDAVMRSHVEVMTSNLAYFQSH